MPIDPLARPIKYSLYLFCIVGHCEETYVTDEIRYVDNITIYRLNSFIP